MRLGLVALLLIALQSCFFFGPSPGKRLRYIEKVKPIDVAIIPGLPLKHGAWDTLLKSRIIWAHYLYKRGLVSRLLFSGNAVYTPWMEGPSMALFAEKLGVRHEDIIIDTVAEHSTENLFYSYHQAKKLGYKTIAVATDPFQCAMLHKFARKNFKEEIYFIPIVYDSIRPQMNIEVKIDTLLTYKQNFIPISKKQNYKDRFKGTTGKNIEK